ncbi:type 1 glutamine amidotransferase [Microbispora bryophytorum]|uniref:type 1 glutamine amidotransferase n=1 Tax=Microbispora bryophytorum TaxID=1460882 RepID=UPI0036AC7B0A
MPESPRVLAVQNGANGDPGRFGEWLDAAGVAVDVVTAFDGSPLPPRLEHDGLIVLGGGYLPDDDDKAPWLPSARALVEQALAWSVPFFGICLGGQMLASVGGGKVQGEAGPERIRRWDVERTRRRGLDLDELYASAVADDPLSRAAWREVASRFAALVRDGRSWPGRRA